MAGTREFNDSANLPKDEKTVLLETHSPEKKSYLTPDLSLASADANRYEEIMANGVNIYNKIRAESNGSGSHTRHRQQRAVQSSVKMASQEIASYHSTEVQRCLQAFQPASDIAVGAEGLGSNNKNSIRTESQYSFDQPSPATTNKPPNFVKKLETFVDSVDRLENDRYMASGRTTLPMEVAQVECPINRHLVAAQKDRCAAVTYAHDGNNLPLDLSNKANRHSGRTPIESFEPLLAANGKGETSSLARLEEKFGANSSILERIGAPPSAAPSSESGFSSGNGGPLGNCLSRRPANSRLPAGVPVTHSKGTVPPVPSAKVHSRHSSNLKVGTSPRQKPYATEAPKTTPRSSGEMPHPSDQDASPYVRYETVLRTACMPGTLLRCGCGSVFGLLSLFMDHIRDCGHSLFGAEVSEAKSLSSAGLGTQRLWTKHGYDSSLPYIPQCIECGRYFQSLPELTVHMIQTAHYLNLVHPNVVHHRPASVCSASTLDSFDGVENSSSETSGYKPRRANILTTSVCSQFPVQEQTMEFSWSGIRPVVLEQHELFSPNCGNSKRHSKTKLKRTPVSQISSGHSKCNSATVKLEADGRVAVRNSGNSSQFDSESRSNYSSPNFQNDQEATVGGAVSNIGRLAQDVMSCKTPDASKGFETRWKEDQTSTVSALVAMQDFVQRSFSSCKDFDIGAKPSVGDKLQSLPAQHSTSTMHWNIHKSSCQNVSPTQTLARRQRRKNPANNNSRLPADTSETSPGGAGHPKRKGTGGRSRNLNYWKNLTFERRNDYRDRTADLLRQQRIKSWQCASSELVDGLTGTTVRPSSVDGVGLLVARKQTAAWDSTPVRKRHRSADFQRAYSTEDSLDDLTRFKKLFKSCSDSM